MLDAGAPDTHSVARRPAARSPKNSNVEAVADDLAAAAVAQETYTQYSRRSLARRLTRPEPIRILR